MSETHVFVVVNRARHEDGRFKWAEITGVYSTLKDAQQSLPKRCKNNRSPYFFVADNNGHYYTIHRLPIKRHNEYGSYPETEVPIIEDGGKIALDALAGGDAE